jgi:hypothetical protein
MIHEVTIADVADLIRRMTSEQRAALVEELARASVVKVRCPSRSMTGDDLRCVREEDHAMPHVAANGEEWLVALRCRLRVEDPHGRSECARLDGHEGDCAPRYPEDAIPAPRESTPLSHSRRARGVCPCGATRQEHEGPTKTGGCTRTGCAKYGKAAA